MTVFRGFTMAAGVLLAAMASDSVQDERYLHAAVMFIASWYQFTTYEHHSGSCYKDQA